MTYQAILKSDDFKKCVDFHGHVCPGLSIGYRASKAGLEAIREIRAEDEEVVAIVETNACSADAVQVLTGCTFGKGNFFFKDYGKMALTLLSRKSGKGVRVSMQPGAFTPSPDHFNLLQKVIAGKADEQETQQFKDIHLKRSYDILEKPTDQLFVIKQVTMEIPEKARIEPSEPCSRCGEATMGSKLELIENKKVCRGCLE
ncbi:MAG: formylmethanofuran dehydrogenase [Desulfobacterales bacterium]|nr:formylmethanofuran dehydrogenase [Desulfobacterales bacterium]